MKHAGAAALHALESVLAQLRTIDGLKEKESRHFLSRIEGVSPFS